MGASTAGERGSREPAAGAMSAIGEVAKQLQSNYLETTPKRLRMLDMFLLFVFATGVLQFVYCVLVGSFPFNSFLAGFSSTVGAFVLTVSLRMQVMEASDNGGVVRGRSLERCFAEYVVCNMVLFLVVMNFMG
ncbi:unnamed protein product [Ectocarpus sp. 12 AP-2014]